jgi:hypothetical protein
MSDKPDRPAIFVMVGGERKDLREIANVAAEDFARWFVEQVNQDKIEKPSQAVYETMLRVVGRISSVNCANVGVEGVQEIVERAREQAARDSGEAPPRVVYSVCPKCGTKYPRQA